MKLDAHKLGIAGAIFSAFGMLLLSFANYLNIYKGAVEHMREMHAFYSPNVGGTIAGMIEAAIITYISLYVIVWIYNSLLPGKKK